MPVRSNDKNVPGKSKPRPIAPRSELQSVWPAPDGGIAYASRIGGSPPADEPLAENLKLPLSVSSASSMPLDTSSDPPLRLPNVNYDGFPSSLGGGLGSSLGKESGMESWYTENADARFTQMSFSAPGNESGRRMSYSDLFRRAQEHQESGSRSKSLSMGSWGSAESAGVIGRTQALQSADSAEAAEGHVHAIEQLSTTPTFSFFPTRLSSEE